MAAQGPPEACAAISKRNANEHPHPKNPIFKKMERIPKNIDDLLRERLHNAAPQPPAFVWENVAQELRKRNRRRLFFWLFFTGITGAGILGLWLANGIKLPQNAKGFEATNTIVQNQASDPGSNIENKLAPTNSETETNIKADKNLKQQPRSPSITTVFKTFKTSAPARSGHLSPPIPLAPKEPTPATLEAKPQKTVFEEAKPLAAYSFSRLQQSERLSILHFKTGALSNNTLRQTWPEVLKPVESKSKAKKAVKNCYDFSKQPSAWIIDAHVGPSLAQREMTARPDDKPYLNKRLSTETRDLAFNAGARATLMLKGNFLLRTGIQYEQMTEVFEFIDPDYVRYHVQITTQNGVTTIDTVGVDYGERYQKTYNRYGMLDIPFAAGIELRKGRSGFNINAGVSFNMLFWKRGAIIAPNTGEPAWFTPKDGTLDVFRPRTGLSAAASIQWFYHLTPRLRVFVEPYYKKILRPVTRNNHPVEQRYGLGGLRLGVSKILN